MNLFEKHPILWTAATDDNPDIGEYVFDRGGIAVDLEKLTFTELQQLAACVNACRGKPEVVERLLKAGERVRRWMRAGGTGESQWQNEAWAMSEILCELEEK